MRLVIAGSRPWCVRAYDKWSGRSRHRTRLITSLEELGADSLARFDPAYVCFLHWSWMIPREIFERFECIGFHMTDLPFGRGGSPLQHLLMRGLRNTQLSAFRVGPELDAGPVYLKRPLSLDGRAEEIFARASRLALKMVDVIVAKRPVPQPQQGEVVTFRRRTPAESRIPPLRDASALNDFIRMLDAQGYPRAFLVQDGFRYEFSHAELVDGRVAARVVITPTEGTGS
jgi:methionyl-tRNA formyltransferase